MATNFTALDAFVAADATAVVGHTPTFIGTAWSSIEQTGTSFWEINDNEAEASGSEASDRVLITVDDAHATNDYNVLVRLDVTDTLGDETFFVLARLTDSSNYYMAGAWPDDDAADKRIHKKVATTVTELATGDDGDASNSDKRMRFEVLDATKRMYWDDAIEGGETLSTTDDALTSIGTAGLALGNIVTSTDDIGTSWDVEDFCIFPTGIAFDDFMEAGANVLLTAHTADPDLSWLEVEKTGVSAQVTEADNSFAKGDTSESSDRHAYILNTTPVDAEYDIEIFFAEGTGPSASSDDPVYILARWADADNFYFGGSYSPSNAADKVLFKEVATTVTELNTSDAGAADGNHLLRFEVLDATKRIFWNSVQVCTSTDNAITAKGQVGYGVGNFAAADDDISVSWDVGIFIFPDAPDAPVAAGAAPPWKSMTQQMQHLLAR